MYDFIRDTAAESAGHSHNDGALDRIVARTVPGDRRDRQTKLGHRGSLDGQGVHASLPHAGQGAHRPAELAHERPLARPLQPTAVARQFRQPACDLETEGDRQGLLPMRAASMGVAR